MIDSDVIYYCCWWLWLEDLGGIHGRRLLLLRFSLLPLLLGMGIAIVMAVDERKDMGHPWNGVQ